MSARMPSIWEGRACRAPICPRCPVLPRTPPCRHSVHAPCLSAAQSLPSMCRRCCNYFFPLLSPLGEPGGVAARGRLSLCLGGLPHLYLPIYLLAGWKYYDMSTNLSLSRVPRTSESEVLIKFKICWWWCYFICSTNGFFYVSTNLILLLLLIHMLVIHL